MFLNVELLSALWILQPANWLVILEVCLGLGMVIFVHELGHFAVAKACGVKCEKFFLGFDINGLKLWSFTRGETEYGIGILPLGGYVKMLGQDDNPGKSAEELERSQVSGTEGEAALDPRSYLAQSVPERMAIISAGVIMNVIFAFVLSAGAYAMGVRESPCIIGSVTPGEAAWRSGMRPGDKVIEIDGLKEPRFRDLMYAVIFGSRRGEPVKFTVERAGAKEPLVLEIVPDQLRGRPTIGVGPSANCELGNDQDTEHPLDPLWNRELAEQLHDKDRVTAIDGKPMATYADIVAALSVAADKPVELGLAREDQEKKDESRVLQVSVPPRPLKQLGLVMKLGPIRAVQLGSPAAKAGVKAGDMLLKVDGQPIGDPMTLPFRLATKPGVKVALSIERDGKPLELTVAQRERFSYEQTFSLEDPLSIPSLGLAYDVTPTVVAVGDPLSGGQIAPGDTIASVRFVLPEAMLRGQKAPKPIDLTKKPGWPAIFFRLQLLPPGTKVELTADGKKPFVVEPFDDPKLFNLNRGLVFLPDTYICKATSLGDDLSLARRETRDSVMQVYGFLSKLASREVSPDNAGGPGTIAAMAGLAASAGIPTFLLFLAMLSANLAVINFLPIPLLDGGHMVFLILEGLRGKPVNERVVGTFQYVGLFFILGLIVFVLFLDVHRLLEWLGLVSGS